MLSASAEVGGPDSFGYTYADQDDGAVYNYVDISATGVVVVDADDGSASVTLGAPFTAYGETFTQLVAGSNGILTTAADLAADDFGNSCPLPDGTAGDSFRVAVLHDDLDTTVYYRYLTGAQAEVVGYPEAPGGISIFQWQGVYFSSGLDVDVEVILFHDTGEMLVMHADVGGTGTSSTTGLQEPEQGPNSLTYRCDTTASVESGTTAVLFTPPPLPIRINEIRMDETGVDNEEYFELVGTPGASLDGISYIVVGDSPSGEIEAVLDLSGESINASGFYVVAESAFSLGVADGTFNINFENADTLTHLLVTEFTGALSDNIDADQDGVFDETPWTAILDRVATIEDGGEDLSYGPPLACTESPTCQDAVLAGGTPPHVFRCPDADGAWVAGSFDITAGTDSPGLSNPCACGDGVVIATEDCDEGGESATCDDDCTVPECGDGNTNSAAGEQCDAGGEFFFCDSDCTFSACGDGTTNAAAGEDCDEIGESATCDDDCTEVACGDGTINLTAGEDCDDGGESAECNDDCTLSECGDGVTNASAGEDCDDAGESATCNADCTFPSCGDGVLNATAGETCDDGGESAECNDDCTASACGDLIVNTTAGETCDDGGRSAECNIDCTAISCGDGIVNATAGEECDGDGAGTPGETAACDDDCTDAMCGDGVLNETAGEACDDAGESATCNDDCTASACGDGVTNATAGEECDDGNNDDGDRCSATCEVEEDPGTTGSTGETEGDTDGSSSGDVVGTSGGADTTGGGDSSSGAGPATMTTGDPVTTSPATTNGDSEGSGGDTDTGGGASPVDDGCSCSADNDGGGTQGALLALFGLAALGRRRRRA